jgi:nucleotide-binding universal stress UspA family protein
MERNLTTILLATDGSDDALQAARIAVDLAGKTGAALHLVHAWTPVAIAAYAYPGMADAYYDPNVFESDARATLATAVAQVEALGGTIAEQHLQMGNAVEIITALGAKLDADLLVVGSRGLGPVRRLVLGSVSDGLVHHADRPVLIARGGEAAWPPASVVVGDDGSADAMRATDFAAQLCHLFGASATIVRALPEPKVPVESTGALVQAGSAFVGRAVTASAPGEVAREGLVEGATGALGERAIALEERFGQRLAIVAAIGDPTALLLDTAAAAPQPALLAVGSRGLGAFRRFRLGSVSTKLLHAATGPVLVVPHAHEEV